MSKNDTADDAAEGKAKTAKKPGAGAGAGKKTTKKAPAKKAAAGRAKTPTKPGAGRGAKKPTKKDAEAIEAAVIKAIEVLPIDDLEDEIEDAQIIAETPAELDATADADVTIEEPPVELSDEERQLQAIYGDDLVAPAKAHVEYQDRQTADEDRPMLPEINAREERNKRWDERRGRRRGRRDERDRSRDQRPGGAPPTNAQQQQPPRQGQGQGHDGRTHDGRPPMQPQQPRPMQPPVSMSRDAAQVSPTTNGHDHDPLGRVGTPLGDAAATVFAQLRNGQPLPVRQLAAMMRKRSLVETDPEQLAPQLKAELLGDERSYRTLGLRPRIVYRGRDLFAPGPVAMSMTADAEAGVATALSRLAGATHRALAQRISKASPAGFERLIHAYLVGAGYRDIAWVKRLGGISYASATAPGIDRQVLISARSGDQPIDRRGIGELRVGVEAKNLVTGILFSARELSDDAEKELERPGRSVAVICGDQLVAALIATGVGVVSSAAPLHYVDDQLLDELLAG